MASLDYVVRTCITEKTDPFVKGGYGGRVLIIDYMGEWKEVGLGTFSAIADVMTPMKITPDMKENPTSRITERTGGPLQNLIAEGYISMQPEVETYQKIATHVEVIVPAYLRLLGQMVVEGIALHPENLDHDTQAVLNIGKAHASVSRFGQEAAVMQLFADRLAFLYSTLKYTIPSWIDARNRRLGHYIPEESSKQQGELMRHVESLVTTIKDGHYTLSPAPFLLAEDTHLLLRPNIDGLHDIYAHPILVGTQDELAAVERAQNLPRSVIAYILGELLTEAPKQHTTLYRNGGIQTPADYIECATPVQQFSEGPH